MSPSFARNLRGYEAVLGDDVLSESIVYSGPSNVHMRPRYLNFAEMPSELVG